MNTETKDDTSARLCFCLVVAFSVCLLYGAFLISQLSSVVEQDFCKVQAVGSNPTAGSPPLLALGRDFGEAAILKGSCQRWPNG